jgi:N-methylhydantoinase B
VLSPIFYREHLVGFTACVLHHSDIGGRVASDNLEVFEEGLFIPLVKLYDAGRLNEALMELIRWNVRTPEQVIGDVRSQVAANHVCAEQVCHMLAEQNLDGLDDLADEIIARSERSIRAAIAEVPPGVYQAQATIEQMEGRADLVIQCAVEVKGSDITVDLTGSSPQVDCTCTWRSRASSIRSCLTMTAAPRRSGLRRLRGQL